MVILKSGEFFAARRKRDENGCWLWTLRKNEHGYGTINGALAHRCVWASIIGPIPDGMCVLHKCDVPACINPEHLYIGTQLDNIRDRTKRGRGNAGQTWKQKNPKQKQTHCVRGHALLPVNRDKYGSCKPCHVIRERERYRRLSKVQHV